jgi:hypothetical protein
MNAGKVSILIPTRNRAQLVSHALSSAFAQDYADIEVIVSNNASDDDTASVLAQHQQRHPQLRVVQCETVLPFHQHWRFLLSHASGDWVIFLCDDDALISTAISRGMQTLLETKLDLVCWNWSFFDHAGGRLRFNVSDNQFSTLDGPLIAQCLLNGDLSAPKPQLNNCLIRREELRTMIDEFPYAFSPFGGDFATAIYLLSRHQRYAIVHEACSIFSEWPGSLSYAAQALDHQAVNAYMQRAGGYPPIPVELPLAKLPLIANRVFANSVAAAQFSSDKTASVKPSLTQLTWDPSIYFQVAWNEITQAFDSPDNRAYFASALAAYPNASRRIKDKLGQAAGFQNRAAKRSWRNHALVQTLEWWFRPGIRPVRLLVAHDIASVSEAANRWPTLRNLSSVRRLPPSVAFSEI